MPLPLIPIAIAMGASALFGAGKTAKAVINSKEADKLNDTASYIVNSSKESLELATAPPPTPCIIELAKIDISFISLNLASSAINLFSSFMPTEL